MEEKEDTDLNTETDPPLKTKETSLRRNVVKVLYVVR